MDRRILEVGAFGNPVRSPVEGRSHSSVESFNTSAKGLDDLPDSPYLVELGLQLVDLAQDVLEARNFGVGGLDDVAGAVVLRLRRGLRLLVELPAVLGITIVVFQSATYSGPAGLN